MAIYAVIKTGGKQYRVAPGDVVKVEKLGIVSGGTVEISEVYLIADDHDITVGHPTIVNAREAGATLADQGRSSEAECCKIRRGAKEGTPAKRNRAGPIPDARGPRFCCRSRRARPSAAVLNYSGTSDGRAGNDNSHGAVCKSYDNGGIRNSQAARRGSR